jgi:hypothetical protein
MLPKIQCISYSASLKLCCSFSHEPDTVYVAFGVQLWALGLRSNSRDLMNVLPSPQVQITDMAQHQARGSVLAVFPADVTFPQENPRLWSVAQADGSLGVWNCSDSANRPVVLYSGHIGSDCSQGAGASCAAPVAPRLS